MSISTTFTLKFAGAAVERGLSRVQSAFKSLGGVAMRIGKSLISPFAGIAAAAGGLLAARSLIRTAVELNAIGEAGRAGDRVLANVTKQMGLFGDKADDVTKRLIDYADATSRMTGVDGEAIGVTQTKLMTFKELAKTADIAGGAFDRATMAAIDMAAEGFGSAESNAVQLGKALNDPIKGINSLSKSGINFTEQEKAKIKTLVESNQMLKAQTMILSAIETQVKGAAAASATSSGKIKASWAQIKDAFAEPMSMGVDSLPGALESVFPKIIAKAEELGKLIGNTISDTVNGDFTRFFMVGSMIGEALLEGMKIILEQGSVKLGQYIKREIFAGASKYMKTDEEKAAEAKAEKEERRSVLQYRAQEFMEEMRGRYEEVLALPTAPPQKFGAHPNMPGGNQQNQTSQQNYTPPEWITIGGQLMRSIDSIDRKLSPQP
jgi:hypothetical protein